MVHFRAASPESAGLVSEHLFLAPGEWCKQGDRAKTQWGLLTSAALAPLTAGTFCPAPGPPPWGGARGRGEVGAGANTAPLLPDSRGGNQNSPPLLSSLTPGAVPPPPPLLQDLLFSLPSFRSLVLWANRQQYAQAVEAALCNRAPRHRTWNRHPHRRNLS